MESNKPLTLDDLPSPDQLVQQQRALTLDDLPSPEELQGGAKKSALERLNSAIVGGGIGAFEKVGKAANWLDQYTGAPLRAGTAAALDLKNPVTAAIDQFGSDNTKAPSGADIVAKLGVPNVDTVTPAKKFRTKDPRDPDFAKPLGMDDLVDTEKVTNPAKILGFPVEMALDLQNLIPAMGAAKRAALSTKLGEHLAARGQKALLKAEGKVGHLFTGVAPGDIAVYKEHSPAIDKKAAYYKTDKGIDTPTAVDDARTAWSRDVQAKRQEYNAKITEALDKQPLDPVHPPDPLIAPLEAAKAKLHPRGKAEAIAQIDSLIDEIRTIGSGENGLMNAKDLQAAKDLLKERTGATFQKAGQIFPTASETQRAAKSGLAEATKYLNDVIPEIKAPNQGLRALHQFEDLPRSSQILEVGKPEAALLAGASGTNMRNRNMLKLLGKHIGRDVLGEAEQISAMRAFGDAPFLPVDTTGKTSARIGVGAVLGKLASYVLGIPHLEYVGAASTSPFALKKSIQARNAWSEAAKRLGVKAEDALPQLLGAKAAGFLEREEERKKKKGPWSALKKKGE